MSGEFGSSGRGSQRSRPTFLARVATDDTARLDRPSATDDHRARPRGTCHFNDDGGTGPRLADTPSGAYRRPPKVETLRQKIYKKAFAAPDEADTGSSSWAGALDTNHQSGEQEPLLSTGHAQPSYASSKAGTGQIKIEGQVSKSNMNPEVPNDTSKLGTFSGVFVPTTLNVLSILMFLRFGFILGQSGVIGMLAMLVVSYLINLVTTLSISAIATNGTVRGGGAYYLISRSLGPEFGGSIGVVFYLGFVLNTGMNAVGLVDCLAQNLGAKSGALYQWLPEGFWWNYLWSSIVLALCTGICLAGSSVFARASNGLLAILLVSTFSIPFSALVMKPFESRKLGIEYTGFSFQTFKGNLMPRLTRGAAGSELDGKETFQDLFGILFPATGGIFAGASMSGDLKHPSKAIPKGTLSGLVLTFLTYVSVILSMAATITRASFYRNVNVIQETNISPVIILLGEFATSFFSSLMGVIGSAKLLQALAQDNVLPGFFIFSQGSKKSDDPIRAILMTHIVAQLTMLSDINRIASLITMTYLMTFLVTNLACFLLKISSAPNFRPSFRFFSWQTAAAGTLVSGIMMFVVDRLYATASVGILVVLFLLIHYTAPPKSWGDVSQSLIYHQVRKYLLRLRQEHVKYWRPQILLLVNNPGRQYKLIQFCNSIKKGALYILGHVIVSEDFDTAVSEARRQQAAWTKYIDVVNVKAFVNVMVAPSVEWGARNIVMNSGLGGMRPNIAVLGFYNQKELKRTEGQVHATNADKLLTSNVAEDGRDRDIDQNDRTQDAQSGEGSNDPLPTDSCKIEEALSVTSYVTLLEDLLVRLRINVAVAKGFSDLELPSTTRKGSKKYIDLWPIQMSAEIVSEGDDNPNVLTTNFDTYTLILQLGCILNTVPAWKKSYIMRIAVFVEYESDVNEERERIRSLLENLRIKAKVLILCLASGSLTTYEIIVNGRSRTKEGRVDRAVEEALQDDQWWQDIQKLRGNQGGASSDHILGHLKSSPAVPTLRRNPSSRNCVHTDQGDNPENLAELMTRKRRHSLAGINRLGVSLGMRTHRLRPDLINAHPSYSSASEDSDSSIGPDLLTESDNDDGVGHRKAQEGEAHIVDEMGRSFISNIDQSSSPKPRRSSKHSSSSAASPTMASSSKGSDRARSRAQAPERTTSAPVLPVQRRPPESTPPKETPRPTSSTQTPNRQSAVRDFTADPIPRTELHTEDTPGPSIMFVESSPSPRHQPRDHSATSPSPASGYPASQAMPLCFNDLPCRAQHLILNELILQHSRDTAVVFTTLPSPIKGTGRNEADSLRYLSDLELLCRGLPPTLLVHSNSMTVTTIL